MAAADEAELRHMVRTAAPMTPVRSRSAIRAANGVGVEMPERGGCWRSARAGWSSEGTQGCAAVAWHAAQAECLLAAEELGAAGLSTTVADARFAKAAGRRSDPPLAREHEVLVTIEEGSVGGFGSHVLHFLARNGLLDNGLKQALRHQRRSIF
jgi:1-deoxy-D-xylulose-5-phosphate synthase